MPSLNLPRSFGSTSTPRVAHVSRNPTASTFETKSILPWVIVAAVAALVALGSCITLVAISISKRRLRRRQLEEARLRDPCLGHKEFSRRRRLTVADQVLEAEEQREAMIRKSLASRSSRSPSMSSRLTADRSSMTERPGTSSVHSLRFEKEFEMRLSRPSSAASLQRARSTSPFPEFPQPTLSRSSSLSRPPLPEVRVDPPPPLEQHPCLRVEDDTVKDRSTSEQ